MTFFFGLLLNILWTGPIFAEKCYMAKEGFVVAQPYMVTKSCFLFSHASNVDLENQSDMIITREEDLHPDPIHSEFLRFVIERKMIKLIKGTPLFSCDYNLQTIAKDFKTSGNKGGSTRTLGYELPEFNCGGTTITWAPARPVHESHCFWVAVPLIRCDEFGAELTPMSVTDPETDE
ncbi:MAG: hypothetical protein KJ630_17800 [Proteobacteria bacterium]|nr:hypothetical protein [Pseudomonadota bacterium]